MASYAPCRWFAFDLLEIFRVYRTEGFKFFLLLSSVVGLPRIGSDRRSRSWSGRLVTLPEVILLGLLLFRRHVEAISLGSWHVT